MINANPTVCVCVCVRACVRACMCACACVRVYVCVRAIDSRALDIPGVVADAEGDVIEQRGRALDDGSAGRHDVTLEEASAVPAHRIVTGELGC